MFGMKSLFNDPQGVEHVRSNFSSRECNSRELIWCVELDSKRFVSL